MALLLVSSVARAELYDLSGARHDRWPGSPGIYFEGDDRDMLNPIVITGGDGPVLTHMEAWPTSSRSHALARVMSATTDDPDAGMLNPGALGYLDDWSFQVGGLPGTQ